MDSSEYKEIPENSMFSGKIVLSDIRFELTLAELWCATSGFETVFLTLFHTWVTCKVSSFLKNWSVLRICLKKCSGDTMTDCSSLSCVSTTTYINDYVCLLYTSDAADDLTTV